MSIFQFKTLQRIILPPAAAGAPNIQGVIIGGGVELDGVPRYNVHYLDSMKRAANGHMEGVIVSILEPDLRAAQPPEMVPASQASAREHAAYLRGGDDARAIEAKERADRLAKRKAGRKASARKRSRK